MLKGRKVHIIDATNIWNKGWENDLTHAGQNLQGQKKLFGVELKFKEKIDNRPFNLKARLYIVYFSPGSRLTQKVNQSKKLLHHGEFPGSRLANAVVWLHLFLFVWQARPGLLV